MASHSISSIIIDDDEEEVDFVSIARQSQLLSHSSPDYNFNFTSEQRDSSIPNVGGSNANVGCSNANVGQGCPTEMKPYVGQIFHDVNAIELFYRTYATRNGFEIKIETSRKHANTDILCSRLFMCKKAKARVERRIFVEETDVIAKIRRYKDCVGCTMCKARMYVVHDKNANIWRVSVFELNYNQDLVSTSKINFMETYRKITPVARNLIITLNDSRVGASKMMNILSTCSGERKNVGFCNRDVKNVVRGLSNFTNEPNDAQAALKLLRKLEVQSLNKFFYCVKVDDDTHLSCILWIDPQRIIAYKKFGDVVTFDTTYRTNRYSMPFAPFTGG